MSEISAAIHKMKLAHESLKDYVDEKLEDRSSSEGKEFLEKVNKDITDLRTQYDELLAASKRPSVDDNSGKSEEQELRESAFTKFLRFGKGENSTTHFTPEETRALSSSSDADGGFLIPASFENDIITQAYNEAELRQLVNVAPTGRDTVHIPSLSKPVIGWGIKNLAISPQDITAGNERIEIFDLRALTLIANNTLDDSAADVWGELLTMFSDAIAEEEDNAISSGAGNNSPQGVISDLRVQANVTNTGVAGALNDGSNNGVDALIAILHALKKTYRKNSTWAMNSTTEGFVRTLKDSQGQYLWQPPVIPGNPTTLLGRPIANPELLPDVAANAFPIVLGDFKRGYKLRDRAGITVQRLTEKYADSDQTGFLIKKRLGGQVVLPEAFRVLKVSV